MCRVEIFHPTCRPPMRYPTGHGGSAAAGEASREGITKVALTDRELWESLSGEGREFPHATARPPRWCQEHALLGENL